MLKKDNFAPLNWSTLWSMSSFLTLPLRRRVSSSVSYTFFRLIVWHLSKTIPSATIEVSWRVVFLFTKTWGFYCGSLKANSKTVEDEGFSLCVSKCIQKNCTVIFSYILMRRSSYGRFLGFRILYRGSFASPFPRHWSLLTVSFIFL